MKKEKASNKALKHIICCIILIITFVITFTRVHAQNELNLETESTVPLKPLLNEDLLELKKIFIGTSYKKYDAPKIIEKDIKFYINKYEKELVFFSTMFGFDVENIKSDLLIRNKDININENNLGNLKDELDNVINYPNPQYGLIEYFYDLINTNSMDRTRNIVSYDADSEYVEKLIIYFSNIYDNVDTSIALSIGAAESGYYQVSYMLRVNNIYGGMSNYGLIRHDNIEIGVLSYIRLLSFNYFGKGLSTIYDIGYVYCPTINENGIKVTSPHWINLVTKAKQQYDNYSYDVEIDDLLN